MRFIDFRKLIIVINIVVYGMLTAISYAQQVDISSSLNPVGSGARALGMGGAFIGIADDATAASWNPAGLVQLEKPEVSAAYSYFQRKQDYNSPIHPEIGAENTMDADGLNFASIVYPFALLNRNMVVSLNYQRLFEMNKDVRFKFNRQIFGSTLVDNIRFTQDGFLYAISPAYAVQVTPNFYMGGTLNFWDNFFGDNGWHSRYDTVSTGSIMGNPIEIRLIQREDASFEGLNANIGFLWNINGSLTLGGVYKTAFDGDLKRKSFFRQDLNTPVVSTDNMTMRMPASYGLGLSYRHSDYLTTAIDVYRTEWSRFVLKIKEGNEVNPLDGEPISNGRLKDTTQVRLGTEYIFIKRKYAIPVRMGIFYDPEPAKGHMDDFYGFSIGTGYARGRFVFDISYQFRTGNNVTGDIPSVAGSNADIQQHTVMASLIIYLDK